MTNRALNRCIEKNNRNLFNFIFLFFFSKILFWYSENGWKQIIKNQYDKFIFESAKWKYISSIGKFKFIFSFFFELKFFSCHSYIFFCNFIYVWQYVIVTYFQSLVSLFLPLKKSFFPSSYGNQKKKIKNYGFLRAVFLFFCIFYFTNSYQRVFFSSSKRKGNPHRYV